MQVYLLDPEDQVAHRNRIDEVRPEIMTQLSNYVSANNIYAHTFVTAAAALGQQANTARIVIHAEERPADVHERRGNAQVVSEMAIIVTGNETVYVRDMILTLHPEQGGGIKRIHHCHRSRDPLHYVLFFPDGRPDGYHLGMKKKVGNTLKNLTVTDFYAFKLHERVPAAQTNQTDTMGTPVFSAIHHGKRLFHEYVLDAYCKVEQNNLDYHRFNQKRLRADLYSGLADAIAADDVSNAGKRIILAASFKGGPRDMSATYHDAMAIVQKYGKPDLFITFTCNPKWNEILISLLPNQTATDRVDLICRVFKMKLDSMIKDIMVNGIFGAALGITYSIEYQKRGLPHAHILVILHQRIRPEDIDNVVSAEIPDPITQPELFKIITTNNIHNPCGAHNLHAVCMVDGECSKKFPKEFADISIWPNDGYVIHRRRSLASGGHSFVNRKAQLITNEWVVPYSPYLSKKYNAHINVEICGSIKSIKYCHKYILKGHDCATIQVQEDVPAHQVNRNEVDEFQNGRYVSSTESCWRMFGNEVTYRYPPVQHLAVHLENGHRVQWAEGQNAEQTEAAALLAAALPPTTTLTSWFTINAEYSRRESEAAANGTAFQLQRGEVDSRTLLYRELPTHFTFQSTGGRGTRPKWCPRKQGNPRRRQLHGLPDNDFSADNVGRVFSVNPKMGEAYYFRTLLSYVKGATCHDDIKMYNGVRHSTFQDACRARGLLQDDEEWRRCIEEANISHTARALRSLFATILTECEPADPALLWDEFKHILCEDILYRYRIIFQQPDMALSPDMMNEALLEIEAQLDATCGKKCCDYQLPQTRQVQAVTCRMIADELAFSNSPEKRAAHANLVQQSRRSMQQHNPAALHIFDEIAERIDSQNGGGSFIDAKAGCGKTFLANALLSYVRQHAEVSSMFILYVV